jgi:hypothetical protein
MNPREAHPPTHNQLGDLEWQLARHDGLYHCRHARESTLLRVGMVQQINALRNAAVETVPAQP